MRKAEIIAAVLVVIGFILMLLHIGFGSILIFTGMMVLAFIYFPMGFAFFNLVRLKDSFKKESYQEVNTKRFVGAIVVGFGLGLIVIGSMIKLMLWPNGSLILAGGLVFSTLALVDAGFYFRTKVRYYMRILPRIAIVGIIGLIIYATPYSTFIDLYHGNNPEYAAVMKEYCENPEDKTVKARLNALKSSK